MEKLANRYNYKLNGGSKLYNVTTKVLPGTGAKVDIVWHDFGEQVVSLLTDPRFTDKDFLHWDNNPSACPPDNLDYIADINTGEAYIKTYKKLITNPETQMLVPIIPYIDASVTGQFVSNPVEALKFTLGIFNKETRDKEIAWRSLGHVTCHNSTKSGGTRILAQSEHIAGPSNATLEGEGEEDQEEFPGKKKKKKESKRSDGAVRDWHAQIDVLLESYRKVEGTGMYWEYFRYGKWWKKNLVFFILFFKCDGEEGDKLCLKYLSRNAHVAMLCRYCKCPTMESNRVNTKITLKTEPEIKRLVEIGLNGATENKREAAKEKLKQQSQQCTPNALHGLRFGQHSDQGIHGAALLDLLHAVLLGIFGYIRASFFNQIGKDSMNTKEINSLAKLYGDWYKRQSDRDIPKSSFGNGIQTGKKQAKEMIGVMLIIDTILWSQTGVNVLHRVYKEQFRGANLANWREVVELCLEWERFLMLDRMDKSVLARLQKKHPYLMYLIKNVVKREEGMGMNVQKFHSILHIVTDILLFGVASCYDTTSNESHHKLAKIAAMLTQKDPKVFEKQCVQRLVEFLLLEFAWEELEGRTLYHYFEGYQNPRPGDMPLYDDNGELRPPETAEQKKEREDLEEKERILEAKRAAFHIGGSKLYVNTKESGVGWGYSATSKVEDDSPMDADLYKYLTELQDATHKVIGQLPIRTEHKRKGVIFHGHPAYRGGEWHDWVLVNWGRGEGNLPGEIWLFVDLHKIPEGRTIKFADQRLDKGVYAVIESSYYVDAKFDKTDPTKSRLLRPLCKEIAPAGVTAKRKFYLANVEAFVEPICVVPDFGNRPEHSKVRYFHVQPRSGWSDNFISWVNNPYEKDHHDDEAEEAEREEARKIASVKAATAAIEKAKLVALAGKK